MSSAWILSLLLASTASAVTLKLRGTGENKLGGVCVDTCKLFPGKYPDKCNCPGFEGEPAPSTCSPASCAFTTLAAGPCKTMCGALTLSAMQLKRSGLGGVCVDTCKLFPGNYPDKCNCPGFEGEPAPTTCSPASCAFTTLAAGPCKTMCGALTLSMMQLKRSGLGGVCVDTCKLFPGNYPDKCNCPGFEGEPAPTTCSPASCAFTTLAAGPCKTMCGALTLSAMQLKRSGLGGVCVDTCKLFPGNYPDKCNCPGFEGEPAPTTCSPGSCAFTTLAAGPCKTMCEALTLGN